jgi:hypothetical protein
MAFSISVGVLDGDEEYTVTSENADDLSLIKKSVSMRRSYKMDPRKKKEVLTNYRFYAVVGHDGAEFVINYKSPTEIEISACTDTPFTISIMALAVYNKPTDSLQIMGLMLLFGLDVYADPCEDSAYTVQLTRVLACFRTVHAITPVTFWKQFKAEIKVVLMADDPLSKAMLERDKNTATIARCVKVAEKRLSDFNLLAKMKQ